MLECLYCNARCDSYCMVVFTVCRYHSKGSLINLKILYKTELNIDNKKQAN